MAQSSAASAAKRKADDICPGTAEENHLQSCASHPGPSAQVRLMHSTLTRRDLPEFGGPPTKKRRVVEASDESALLETPRSHRSYEEDLSGSGCTLADRVHACKDIAVEIIHLSGREATSTGEDEYVADAEDELFDADQTE
eukprot:TRINITY_DN115410_c0_g1_i1.p1 TRINITY_DN115410_c0_g1~~TRINITY_DN115410_c0_g1_i1.p1  ORF type:complete len:141 (-),score=20.95 TRINITY_DN115410_c0_g1_i1:41-463(-)